MFRTAGRKVSSDGFLKCMVHGYCRACAVDRLIGQAILVPAWLQIRLVRTSAIPVITVPIRMQEKLKKLRKKLEAKELQERCRLSMGGNRDVTVISCSRKVMNHYKGQVYDKFKPVPLASQGWANRKSNSDYFVINAVSRNPAVYEESAEKSAEDEKNFQNLGLRAALVDRLDKLDVRIPTAIQTAAVPHILSGGNAVCAAETGSGKTFAYLLPILNSVLDFKEVSNRDGIVCSPLALILVPGRELAFQIQRVMLSLTENLPLKSTVLVGGLGTKKMMLYPVLEEIDVVVSTMGVIKKLVSSGLYDLQSIRHVVIDEADTMMDDSFSEMIVPFLKKIKFRDSLPTSTIDPNIGAQLILMGATLPRSLDATLRGVVAYSTLTKIVTPYLHRLMPHVPQKFIRVKKSEKPGKLLTIVKDDLKKNKRMIIFTKNAATCSYVKLFLEENGVKAENLSADMNARLRHGRFEAFQQGHYNVLVSTDLASRGLDTITVQHILNYDFPLFMSDYIHRVGRVGRVGSLSGGHMTSFVSGPLEAELVQKIEMAARRMEALPNVNANIKRKLFGQVQLTEGDEYLQ